MNQIRISTDKTLLDIPLIHDFLSKESYWAKGIPLKTVTRSIKNSFCFGVYKEQEQIGFARVVTDYATFAYLADVFILPAYRGQKLSKKLVEFILSHSDLQGLRRWMLATADAHELYRQFGFNEPTQPDRLMEIRYPDIYK